MKAIVLTRGRIAAVDDEDFERLNQFKWSALKVGRTYYAVRHEGKRFVFMHREILNIYDPKVRVDHENCCGVDNWRTNLRVATAQQNGANAAKRAGTSSRFKGVAWNKALGKWTAQIKVSRKFLHLGAFVEEETAARAYDEAAIVAFGAFAKPNFT